MLRNPKNPPITAKEAPYNHEQILTHHFQEWLESSVDEKLIALNLLSLSGDEIYDYLLYALPDNERRNDGRLRDKWLHRYAPLESGGWWVCGLDPYNNWEPMLWGRFKSDTPRTDLKKNKPIKYESPARTANRLTYFNIPPHIWDKIAKRYGIKRYHSPLALRLSERKNPPCFWEWLQQHPEIPILLTEGEKKAACLLSQGFVAIASPGIWNARVGSRHQEKLHPDLMPMAQKGRTFKILFDYEEKPKTRYAVYQATLRTGEAILNAGCQCEVASLPGPEKGVDDFVTARGESAAELLTKIIDDALTLEAYKQLCYPRERGLSSKYRPHVEVNTPYLSELETDIPPLSDYQHLIEKINLPEPPETMMVNPDGDPGDNTPDTILFPHKGLVVLWSGMGTGKTQLMSLFRQLHPNDRFLNLGHRVNLLKNLSKRLNTQMYSALEQGKLGEAIGLSITVDSLYKLENQLVKYDCIFIDEACQYLAHLLHSKTCKEHRAEILEVLEYLVYNAKLVVLADAHMDDLTVDFFRALRPEGEPPFIIKNNYKQPGRMVYWDEGADNSATIAQINTALMLKQKIMVVSDSKKLIKKIEAAMTVKVFDDRSSLNQSTEESSQNNEPLKIWSIHAENSGSEENVAFIENISSQVKNVDLLLASPSLGTGVDIPDYHFDAVFGIFHAVSQTATECAQALHRYRIQVPLHIWVAPRPPFGYQETNAVKIKERMLQLNETTAFLIRLDRETGKRGAERDYALDAYCEIEANRNRSINNLRADLRSLLSEMAYNIIPLASEKDRAAAEELKQAAHRLDMAHITAIVNANSISKQEYLSRQAKDYLQPEEIVECEKYRIQRDYGMPVTEELVKRDDGGHLIRQLIALEAIIAPSEGTITDPKTGRKYPAPPKIVAERDLRERDNLPLCMDWQNYSGKWLARHILGLPKILMRLFAGEEICATDPDLVKMTQIALATRTHLKAILGFTVPQDCQPMWLLGTAVNQLGLRTAARKKGKRGEQVTYYSLRVEDLAFAVEVLEYREQQRIERAKKEQEWLEKARRHQAKMQSLYGIDPPQRRRGDKVTGCSEPNSPSLPLSQSPSQRNKDSQAKSDSSVSTPPLKGDVYPLEESLDTENNWPGNTNSESSDSSDKTLKNLQPFYELFKRITELPYTVIKEILSDLKTLRILINCRLLRLT